MQNRSSFKSYLSLLLPFICYGALFFFFSIFPQTFIYFFEYHLLIEVLVELQCCVTFRYIFIQIVFPYRSLHKILNIVPCAIQ